MVGAYAAQAVLQWWKGRGEAKTHRENIDVALEKHRDDLTFQLLNAAREEVAAARAEATESRAMQLRFAHFDEALEHIEMLIAAKASPDTEAWTAAQRRAEQFLTRMKRWQDATGALKNEAQVIQSRESLGDGGMTSIIKDI